MSRFDWDDLRFFLAVARAGRLTVAARRLGADHATVSRRISALESALKAKLFERRPQGYTLTAHGERLLTKAEAMETEALAASSEIGGADLAISGIVRIGTPDGFGTTFLAPRIAAFAAQYPDLEIQLIAMPRLLSLSKREADVAVSLAPPREGKIVARKLTDYRLGLYATADYLGRHPAVAAAGDLHDHEMIGYIDDLIFTPELDSRGPDARDGSRCGHLRPAPFRGGPRSAARPGAAGSGGDHAIPLSHRSRGPEGRGPNPRHDGFPGS